MEVCAGAMRVSSATGLASATIETQVVFSARIIKVKVGGGFTATAFAGGGLERAEALGTDVEAGEFVAVEVDGIVFEDGVAVGRVGIGRGEGFSATAVPEDNISADLFPADSVPEDEEAFPIVSELVAAIAAGGVGAAPAVADDPVVDDLVVEGEDNCAGDAVLASAWRRKFHTASTSVTSSKAAASVPQGTRKELSSVGSSGFPAGYFSRERLGGSPGFSSILVTGKIRRFSSRL
jgi:hypothetical protein